MFGECHLCDEIIVVDDSTDNTVEVAREFTDKVFLRIAWPNETWWICRSAQLRIGAITIGLSRRRRTFYAGAREGGSWRLQEDFGEVTIFRVRRREYYRRLYSTPMERHGKRACSAKVVRNGMRVSSTRADHARPTES